jgi:hypothetical protein
MIVCTSGFIYPGSYIRVQTSGILHEITLEQHDQINEHHRQQSTKAHNSHEDNRSDIMVMVMMVMRCSFGEGKKRKGIV